MIDASSTLARELKAAEDFFELASPLRLPWSCGPSQRDKPRYDCETTRTTSAISRQVAGTGLNPISLSPASPAHGFRSRRRNPEPRAYHPVHFANLTPGFAYICHAAGLQLLAPLSNNNSNSSKASSNSLPLGIKYLAHFPAFKARIALIYVMLLCKMDQLYILVPRLERLKLWQGGFNSPAHN
jgi:hypothetical protein